MSRAKTMLIAVLGSFVLASTAWAMIPERYQTIVDRNSFGLNPPAPVDTNAPPVVPPANVKLTGFTKMSGERKAYFVIQPKDAKEQPQYLSLGEGQREGILEIVKIIEEDGEVRIRNSGTEMTLSLKNNGIKPGPVPGAPPAPAMPPPPGPGVAAVPNATPSVVYNPNANAKVVANVPGAQPATPGTPGIPGAPGAVPQGGQPSPETMAGAQPSTGNPPSPMRTIPTRTLRLPPVTPQNPNAGP